jgi:hypothetical protein
MGPTTSAEHSRPTRRSRGSAGGVSEVLVPEVPESDSPSSPSSPSAQPRQTGEDREQVIARRRAAQREWRAARQCVERASQSLVDAVGAPVALAVSSARDRLERAQLREREARSTYYRVAEETGALLGRIQHLAARRA